MVYGIIKNASGKFYAVLELPEYINLIVNQAYQRQGLQQENNWIRWCLLRYKCIYIWTHKVQEIQIIGTETGSVWRIKYTRRIYSAYLTSNGWGKELNYADHGISARWPYDCYSANGVTGH